MSPLGLGTDLAISVRGPAAHTGIVSLKATHGRVPMTGIWPRVPRRFWHVGPMARSIRDLSLAFSQLAGPDGQDGYSSSAIPFDAGVGSSNKRSLRIGWLVEPGFGPIDREVAATGEAAAEALKDFGPSVEPVRIPALERDFALDVFSRLHVLEMKPALVETTAGRSEDEISYMARFVLSLPDTPAADYIDAVQKAERLTDGYAEYHSRSDRGLKL
jgi:aspartyl-tRNA(Asn)/glutamyl-tRNA(Gln) amidotransferase subunit A